MNTYIRHFNKAELYPDLMFYIMKADLYNIYKDPFNNDWVLA